jgi:hypothetical protein
LRAQDHLHSREQGLYLISRSLASSLCLGHSLNGNATPLQKLQIKVRTPLNCQASSQAGSSLEFNRVLSWMHPRCGRFRVNGSVCDKLPPFPNLSCNLSMRAGLLPHPIQRRSIAQRDRVTRPLGLDAPPCYGPTGRCPVQSRPRCAWTK